MGPDRPAGGLEWEDDGVRSLPNRFPDNIETIEGRARFCRWTALYELDRLDIESGWLAALVEVAIRGV
jgi:hypothetical protein